MADFNEQLDTIAKLREQAQQHEEAVYGARVGLRRAELRLARAERGETVAPAERSEAVAQLRAQMAALNAKLAEMRAEERAITAELEQIRTQQRELDDLKARLAARREQDRALRQKLAELQAQAPAPRDEIAQLEQELEKLKGVIAELEQAILAATERQDRARQREQELRATLDGLRRRMEGLRADLARLHGRVTELLQPVFGDKQAVESNIAELREIASRNSQAGTRARADLGRAIGDLYREDPHPRRTLARLNDETPFLLFPMRLETVFAGSELWVRVFPDEIVVHTHESTLTDTEVDAGELYWIELLVASHLRTQRDARQADAWRHVVDLFGGQRGAWIAQKTRPADWDALAAVADAQSLIAFLNAADAALLPALLALPMSAPARAALNAAIADDDGDAFFAIASQLQWNAKINTAARAAIAGFPPHDLTKTDAWSRAPRTRVMPDRFVLLLYATESSPPQEVTGELIADTVFLGPDPLDHEATLVRQGDGARTLDGDCKWLADFDTAVAQGLGFRVRLNEQQIANGFARVVVLGLRLSANAEQSAAMVEELIGNHQYSPSGFSLVRQGTPTNNTERDGSGYSDNDPYDDLKFYTAIDAPAFDPLSADARVSQTDGRQLADALGISYGALQSVPGAEHTDLLEARAMNTALFPSTLGYWLKTWMSPIVTPAAARLTRQFFNRHVTGRGPLPAIRVGNQPYGVLLTSDLSRWKYASPQGGIGRIALFDEMTPFLTRLREILVALEAQWQAQVKDLAHVGKEDADASKLLMEILALHPTSVEFFQRVGFHQFFVDDYLNFATKGGRYTNELASLVRSLPATMRLYLQSLGVAETADNIAKATALNVLWQHYLTSLTVPSLVERKPSSETATLTANYIDWLRNAESPARIIDESFPGEKPTALLYLMLRNAMLLQLHAGSYDWLAGRGEYTPALQRSMEAYPVVGVIPTVPAVSKYELMNVAVGTVMPEYAAPATSVADLIWRGPKPAEVEAAYAQEQRDVLALLAGATTASLERCLVEHLDCCQYRLDAWVTGLFAQRLYEQRRSDSVLDRRTGIYIGAVGWVENLKRTPRVTMRPESLPESLRPGAEDQGALLEEDDVAMPGGGPPRVAGSRRGGFTHAPSINHAAAAALLRNAYLTHSDSDQADVLSNNLSSDRVRRAQFMLEGMRNGQPIEALLGYQFERALHDRTSLSAAAGDSPVLELNEFIQPYREAFPFQSKEIPQSGTGPASETVPPFSVVNGLTLMDATLDASNGYGLSTVLDAPHLPSGAQSAAILLARDGLRETLDAVKDLLGAENAYQLVQGNFDRVAAVSLAQKDARIPPTLEVIDTPRGSQFMFTQRVTLQFDDIDPSLASSRPWPGELSPRALAEPDVNRWLGTLLGKTPGAASCEAWWVEGADDAVKHDARFVTLADLNLQPVDFVALTAINGGEQQGGSELEQRIARFYREADGIPESALVRIDFDPAAAPGDRTLGQVLPLARRARALLGECRALNAQDFLPAAGGKATTVWVDKTNPGGYDHAELRLRVQTIFDALQALADRLDGPAAPTVTLLFAHAADDADDDETFTGKLGDAFTKLDAEGVDFADLDAVTTTFGLLDAQALRATLAAVALFGIADAFVPEIDLSDEAARRAVLSRARRIARRLRRTNPAEGVLDRAAVLLSVPGDKPIEEQVSSLVQASQILFGDSFKCLPMFTCFNEVDIAAAAAARAQLLSFAASQAPGLAAEDIVEEWLQSAACVRPRLATFETLRVLADGLNDEPVVMQPVQLPFRDKDSWLAVEFPELDPVQPADPSKPRRPFGITRDTLSITAHGANAFTAGRAQRGLLLDEWTEEIPSAEENTGISFRFNRPNAVPPQALLLAVTPEQTGAWSWDNLVGIVNDTLARAKRRAVEPAHVEEVESSWNVMAPATVSEFSMIKPAEVSLDHVVIAEYAKINDVYAGVLKV